MGQEAAKERTIKISVTLTSYVKLVWFFPVCLGLSVLPRFTILPETTHTHTHKDKNISNNGGALGVPGKNPLGSAGDMGLMPGPRRFHMPQSN